jgi:hypothetical protein
MSVNFTAMAMSGGVGDVSGFMVRRVHRCDLPVLTSITALGQSV